LKQAVYRLAQAVDNSVDAFMHESGMGIFYQHFAAGIEERRQNFRPAYIHSNDGFI
jgi:hypothetical protein